MAEEKHEPVREERESVLFKPPSQQEAQFPVPKPGEPVNPTKGILAPESLKAEARAKAKEREAKYKKEQEEAHKKEEEAKAAKEAKTEAEPSRSTLIPKLSESSGTAEGGTKK